MASGADVKAEEIKGTGKKMEKTYSMLFKNIRKKTCKTGEKKAKKGNFMSLNKSKNKPTSQERVFKKALEDMCKGLDQFGPKEILNLMVVHSHRDNVMHQLLTRFPTVVALGDFLNTLPIRRVDKRTFRRLERSGCIV